MCVGLRDVLVVGTVVVFPVLPLLVVLRHHRRNTISCKKRSLGRYVSGWGGKDAKNI